MPDIVCIRYEITPEYVAANTTARNRAEPMPGSNAPVLVTIVFICSLPFVIWSVWLSIDLRMKWLVLATLLLPLWILFLALRLFNVKRVITTMLEGHPDADRRVTVTVSETGWLVEALFSRTESQWAMIQKVTHLDHGLLVWESFGATRWFPNTAFDSDGDIETFVRLVQRGSVNYDDCRQHQLGLRPQGDLPGSAKESRW